MIVGCSHTGKEPLWATQLLLGVSGCLEWGWEVVRAPEITVISYACLAGPAWSLLVSIPLVPGVEQQNGAREKKWRLS